MEGRDEITGVFDECDTSDWCVPEGELVAPIFDESWAMANLEKGKTYKVEYSLTATGDGAHINVMPKSGDHITIDSFSVVEVESDVDKLRVIVPKGMSKSFHHILSKQRRKR